MNKRIVVSLSVVFSFVLSLLSAGSVSALSCTEEYDPVCGNDGKTYQNECYMLEWSDARNDRVNVIGIASQGPCETDATSNESIMCTMDYTPVCGEDGETYSNRCVAEEQNKVAVAYEGECTTDTAPDSDVVCITQELPVCGEDGKTYSNRCVAEEQNGVAVAHEGQCIDADLTQNCQSYFDGCNTCMIVDGQKTSCTEKYCLNYETPYCMDTIELVEPETSLSSAQKEKLQGVVVRVEKVLATRSIKFKEYLYEKLFVLLEEKIAEMKDSQVRGSSTSQEAREFQVKLDMYIYLHYLLKMEYTK